MNRDDLIERLKNQVANWKDCLAHTDTSKYSADRAYADDLKWYIGLGEEAIAALSPVLSEDVADLLRETEREILKESTSDWLGSLLRANHKMIEQLATQVDWFEKTAGQLQDKNIRLVRDRNDLTILVKEMRQRIEELEATLKSHNETESTEYREALERIDELEEKAESFEGSFNATLKDVQRLDAALAEIQSTAFPDSEIYRIAKKARALE